MLNELINQDSDDSNSDDYKGAGNKYLDAKQVSINNLGFDIDKALLE